MAEQHRTSSDATLPTGQPDRRNAVRQEETNNARHALTRSGVGSLDPTVSSESQSCAKVPKLNHRKSRNGCQKCRARRVKCDETHPVCGGCKRHRVPCIFDREHSAVQISRLAPKLRIPEVIDSSRGQDNYVHHSIPIQQFPKPPSNFESESVPIPLQIPESRSRRLLELRLLHHYVAETALTFPGAISKVALDVVTLQLPRLAYTHDALLYSIFSLASLHLISEDAVEASKLDLQAAHRTYRSLSLRSHSNAIDTLSIHNADAISLTCSLTSLITFAAVQHRSLAPYTPPMDWLQTVRGAREVFKIGYNLVRHDPTAAIVILSNVPPMAWYNFPLLFAAHHRERYTSLLARQPNHEAEEPGWLSDYEVKDAYEKTLSYIGAGASAVERGEEVLATCRRLTTFAMLVPGRFVEMVREERPRALVVLALFFELAARCKEVWWVGDVAKREIGAIYAKVGEEWHEEVRCILERIG